MKLRNPLSPRYWKLRNQIEQKSRRRKERFWRHQAMELMQETDNAKSDEEKEIAESSLEMWIQFCAIDGFFYSKSMLRICNQRKENQVRMTSKRIK